MVTTTMSEAPDKTAMAIIMIMAITTRMWGTITIEATAPASRCERGV
jgi:hypothetical protein